jgi:hypothetical protein
MKIFTTQTDSIDAKAKDSVLRLLYAYEKYKNDEGKKNALSFKKKADFDNRDKDIENAIKNVNNKADFDYMNSIIDFLWSNDYIQKLNEIKDDNVTYYMLTKSGILFYESNGFEKELKDQRQLTNENYYKFLTIILAFFAIISPVIFDRLGDKTDDKLEKINSSLNELNGRIQKLEHNDIDTIIQRNDTLPNKMHMP